MKLGIKEPVRRVGEHGEQYWGIPSKSRRPESPTSFGDYGTIFPQSPPAGGRLPTDEDYGRSPRRLLRQLGSLTRLFGSLWALTRLFGSLTQYVDGCFGLLQLLWLPLLKARLVR